MVRITIQNEIEKDLDLIIYSELHFCGSDDNRGPFFHPPIEATVRVYCRLGHIITIASATYMFVSSVPVGRVLERDSLLSVAGCM